MSRAAGNVAYAVQLLTYSLKAYIRSCYPDLKIPVDFAASLKFLLNNLRKENLLYRVLKRCLKTRNATFHQCLRLSEYPLRMNMLICLAGLVHDRHVVWHIDQQAIHCPLIYSPISKLRKNPSTDNPTTLLENLIKSMSETICRDEWLQDKQAAIKSLNDIYKLHQTNNTLLTMIKTIIHRISVDEVISGALTIFVPELTELSQHNTEYRSTLLCVYNHRISIATWIYWLDISSDRNWTTLNFFLHGIDEATIRLFAHSIKDRRFPSMKQLILNHNPIGDAGVEALAFAFTNGCMSNLQSLQLSSINLTDIGMYHLVNMLLPNSKLTSLDVSRNNIGANGTQAFANILASECMSSLTMLNYSMHQLDCESIRLLTSAIKLHTALTSLTLSNSGLTDCEMTSLSEFINDGCFKSITDLSLSSNKFGDVGLCSFVATITQIPSLTSLSLAMNKISDEGAVMLSDSALFERKSSLKLLDVSSSHLSDKSQNLLRISALDLLHCSVVVE